MNLSTLDIWIATSDSRTRGRLREVLSAVMYKTTVKFFRSPREVVDELRVGTHVDFLFLSYSLGKDNITSFLSDVDSEENAKAPTVIITLDSKTGDNSSEIASLYVGGIAGFISEPYSTVEISNLLETLINNENKVEGKGRIFKAAQFLMADAMAQIDRLAALLMRGEDAAGYALKELKTISKSLATAHNQDPDLYFRLMVDTFEKAKPPSASLARSKVKKAIIKVNHPGVTIKEIMAQRQLTPDRLASMLRIELPDFEQLLAEQRSIDQALAQELSRVIGKTPTDWMRLQGEYDVYKKKR